MAIRDSMCVCMKIAGVGVYMYQSLKRCLKKGYFISLINFIIGQFK